MALMGVAQVPLGLCTSSIWEKATFPRPCTCFMYPSFKGPAIPSTVGTFNDPTFDFETDSSGRKQIHSYVPYFYYH